MPRLHRSRVNPVGPTHYRRRPTSDPNMPNKIRPRGSIILVALAVAMQSKTTMAQFVTAPGPPSDPPTTAPSPAPTQSPTTPFPTQSPTTKAPSQSPTTKAPSQSPTTGTPSTSPTTLPSSLPSEHPTLLPSSIPSEAPSSLPSEHPTLLPSSIPSETPSSLPSEHPTLLPSSIPSEHPSGVPSEHPTLLPSSIPSEHPSGVPSEHPSLLPSSIPSEHPSGVPSEHPSLLPSSIPSEHPSGVPSEHPSSLPSSQPSVIPSLSPSISAQPSSIPSESPSDRPSSIPSESPSSIPSVLPSSIPSKQPSGQPSVIPSESPSISQAPSESPSANPSQGCDNIRDGCGWGIFNPWTCQCDCPVGICRDNNGYCLNPCQETINVNPWSGCAPGWDCPWHPSEDGGYCESEFHIPNEFEIYRTAKQCCDEHYGGSAQCVTDSKTPGKGYIAPMNEFPDGYNNYAPVEADYLWQSVRGQEPHWYPDLYGQQNCVYGSDYEHWMNENKEIRDQYLHGTANNCCEKWYPNLGASCPEPLTAEVTSSEVEDEAFRGPMKPYFFPNFEAGSCGAGINYPSWMGINGYERHYLFRDGADCCDRYFKGAAGPCPSEFLYDPGYYWEKYENDRYNTGQFPTVYNHTYYPQMEAGTCVNGTDFPDWMNSDTEFRQRYIFKDLEGCCTEWFTAYGVNTCVNNVIQGLYEANVPCAENRPLSGCNTTLPYSNSTEHKLTMWYADLDAYTCKNDGDAPDFMLLDDYSPYYLFNAQNQCCHAFGWGSNC